MSSSETLAPAGILTPRDDDDVRDIVASAVAASAPIEVIGHGSKRLIGRPVQAAATLDLSALTGVTLYEPEELVLSAKAGTSVAEIGALLATHGQELAFEPIDYGPLFGAPAGRGTLGGLLAANLAGPRRIKAGAARDHTLGLHAISGRAEAFKAGGRVVKNVTGYDLSRGLSGSWGTLAVFTEITLKVLPVAETETTLALAGLDATAAVAAMTAAMGSSADVSAAAHLPSAIAAALPGASLGAGAVTLLRLEGIAPSVAARVTALSAVLAPLLAAPVEAEASRDLWRSIRDVVPLAERGDPIVWRVSVAPSAGPVIAAAAERLGGAWMFDWAGGLVWVSLPDALSDAGAPALRAAVAAAGGGHATLIKAPAAVRALVDPFEPQPPALAGVTRRLKEVFDPRGVLEPGRMYAGV
ncbi:FAD-binding protein [Pseudoxanthobacter sp. M-2]|uniref:FAD-binding protein n=1 Tax=Pseudoxanthobacter sp. M-2 TaxID=3078754 RepID=UPI0038FD2BCA